jgi:hypothetical protein
MLPMLLGPTEVELWRRSVPGRPESIREKIWPTSRTEQMCSGSSILPSQSWLAQLWQDTRAAERQLERSQFTCGPSGAVLRPSPCRP